MESYSKSANVKGCLIEPVLGKVNDNEGCRPRSPTNTLSKKMKQIHTKRNSNDLPNVSNPNSQDRR